MSDKDTIPDTQVFSRLEDVPEDLHLSHADYDAALNALQQRLRRLQIAVMATRARVMVVFEGWDASGKGGVINRLTQVLDPRGAKVWPIGPPDDPEVGHHYLHRFWIRMPGPGEIGVFDRSWYGRVLVERVEELATRAQWHRGFMEINDFERLLIDDGVHLVKLFLHVSASVQKARFKERFENPLKQWKLSVEDFANLERRGDYEIAIEDMLTQTSTQRAPWAVVPCPQKRYGRIAAINHIVTTLEQQIDVVLPGLSDAVTSAARKVF